MPEFQISPQRQYVIDQFVARLPELRRKAGLKQYELAECIGKSRQKLSDIERGVAPMGWDTFLAIVFVLLENGLQEDLGKDSSLGRLLEKELKPNREK